MTQCVPRTVHRLRLCGFVVVLLGAAGVSLAADGSGRGASASAESFGDLPGEDLGSVLNRMFAQGIDNIYIPVMEGLRISTPVRPPKDMRVRLWSDGLKGRRSQVLCQTGDAPAIDLQGCMFAEIHGLGFSTRRDSEYGRPSACAILMARLPSGISAGNHQIRNCMFEGAFSKCIIYNIGSEEVLYENNYLSHYGVREVLDDRSACYVISNVDVFPEIVSRAPRTKGNSTSAIAVRNGTVIQYNAGTSIFYLGQWAGDVTIDVTYCGAVMKGGTGPRAMITTEGIVHGINVSTGRLEYTNPTHLLHVKGTSDCGGINFIKGSFLRSGKPDPESYAFEIEGKPENEVTLNVSPACAFYFYPDPTDLYFIRSDRTLRNSFLTLGRTSDDIQVRAHRIESSVIHMPKEENLFVGELVRSTCTFSRDSRQGEP